jgi:hypothetical protein
MAFKYLKTEKLELLLERPYYLGAAYREGTFIHLEIAHQLDRQNDLLERIANVLELWGKAEGHYSKMLSP